MSELFDIREELKKLPDRPGVYIMHGPSDEIIYVGKAVNLKNRVRQYFQSPEGKTAKIRRMISLIRRFEYIVVGSELEALVLENNLIKENHPKYNTLLKDDKTYPYIKVSSGEMYPRISMTRKVLKDKAQYYGPYTSVLAVREIIELLRRLYRIRTCSRVLEGSATGERPCLYAHIGECSAPCSGLITKETYADQIKGAVDFLAGKREALVLSLTEKMQKASEDMAFEKAAEYRDLLKAVKEISEDQKVTGTDDKDRDVIGLAVGGRDTVVQVFFVRRGKMTGRELYHMDTDEKDSVQDILSDFIRQFYNGTPYVPKEILVQTEPSGRELLETWLTGVAERKIAILSKKRGAPEKLVEMAVENARMAILRDRDRMRKEEAGTKGAMREIGEAAGIPCPVRVESYDISNTAGYGGVASMVVFEEGRPKKSDYRKFRIRSVEGPDDYASMREVLERRFRRGLEERSGGEENSFTRFPDLLLVDGGKGQISSAERVLKELGISLPVAGMVKDDRHRTRDLMMHGEELHMDTASEGFKLLTRIQDETHRFAIEYHRSLRNAADVHSVLDEIKGIGTKRRRALMRHFREIEKIRTAQPEELLQAEGMDRRSAQNVYDYFHPGEQTGADSAGTEAPGTEAPGTGKA